MDVETLAIASRPLPYFRTAEFSATVLESADSLKRLLGTDASSEVAFLAASGTGAMEAAVASTFNTSDKVLIIEGGLFGRRFASICHALGVPYVSLRLRYGESLTADKLEEHVRADLTGLLVNLHETSTGQLYDLSLLGRFCADHHLVMVVDAIGSFLADPYCMDEAGVAVTILSSQKGLGLPPGLSMVVANAKTARERVARNRPMSVYLNLAPYFSDIRRGQTPFTPAQPIIYQLHDKLLRVEQVGAQYYLKRCLALAQDFRSLCRMIPVELPSYPLSNALTPIKCTAAYEVFTVLKERYGLCVTPSGGELRDCLLRVGHLGNLTKQDNIDLFEALSVVLDR